MVELIATGIICGIGADRQYGTAGRAAITQHSKKSERIITFILID